MEQATNEVKVFEVEDNVSLDVTFNVIESELLAVSSPTVQVYSR